MADEINDTDRLKVLSTNAMWSSFKALVRDKMMDTVREPVEGPDDAMRKVGRMEAFAEMHDTIKIIDSEES